MTVIRTAMVTLVAASATFLAGCGGGSTVDHEVAGTLGSVKAGYVSAIDQIGLPVGVEAGHFEEQQLDVQLAQPFPTGVDALNALQSGEVDLVQVGTPAIAAAQKGLDLVLVGNYTGAASRRSIDETMAVVARTSAGVSAKDLRSLRGKRIGVSVGSINHLYLLGLLAKAKLAAADVKIVNTAPPDMAVALQTNGIDVAIVWDPWPITITQQVAGTTTVLRGGGYIPFVGYIVGRRDYVEQNQDIVQRFLTARATTDQWMRENPDQAAEAATRWLPGTKLEVAKESMRFNVKQLDPRFSACNYLALDTVASLLAEQKSVQPGFDVRKHFAPQPLLTVMQRKPELFDDLPVIPATAMIPSDYTYDRQAAERACPS